MARTFYYTRDTKRGLCRVGSKRNTLWATVEKGEMTPSLENSDITQTQPYAPLALVGCPLGDKHPDKITKGHLAGWLVRVFT